MTFEDRAQAVAQYGFTPRQAAFLTTVMLHSGVCLPRQYTKFAGIVFGHNTRDFFARLTREKVATAYACWSRQGTYFHIHHKGLYRAIGEPDNRHSRRPTIPRTAERLMLLDAVLDLPNVPWLATEKEKVAHFVKRCGDRVTLDHLPALVFTQNGSKTVRYFPDKLPIGIVGYEELLFVFVVTEPNPESIRGFMRSHRQLLERLYRWRLRLISPGHLAASQGVFKSALGEFFAQPLNLSIADEFKWYCETRRALEQGTSTPAQISRERYARARRAFSSPRFYGVYREWLKDGFGVINQLISPLLRDMLERGQIQIETQVLTHRYLNIATAAATA